VQVAAKRWVGSAAALTVIQIAASALLRPGPELTAASDITSALLLLALLLAFFSNARAARGRLRAVWMLLALSWAFWLADQCGWIVYDVVFRKPMPTMFPGDILLFLAGIPVLAALLLRPHVDPTERSVRFGMPDFLQLMLWWIYLYLFLVTCWQYVWRSSAIYNRNFDRLYVAQILVLLTALGVLLYQSSGPWRRFYFLLFAALFLNYFVVVAENRAIEAGVYFTGSWYDVWFAGSLLFFLGVAAQARGLIPVPATGKDEGYGSWLFGFAAVAVLSLPAMVIYSELDGSVPPAIVRFRLTITSAAIVGTTALVFVKQHRLYSDLKRVNAILAEASITDPLTGIRNRRFFSETIGADVAATLREFGSEADRRARDLIFYLIDIDNFKEVNDQFGHDAGDRILVEVARRISSVMRASDILLRWGGEEFLIISRFTDRRRANILALRVLEAVRGKPFAVGDAVTLTRTCSVGWAAFPWLEHDPSFKGHEEVLILADQALTQAKAAGKNRAIGMTPQ
jgi:diguanylate cyclase (GGDEF)-like protein